MFLGRDLSWVITQVKMGATGPEKVEVYINLWSSGAQHRHTREETAYRSIVIAKF